MTETQTAARIDIRDAADWLEQRLEAVSARSAFDAAQDVAAAAESAFDAAQDALNIAQDALTAADAAAFAAWKVSQAAETKADRTHSGTART